MDEGRAQGGDQAAGLRRLFGGTAARLAPILVEATRGPARAASIVRLAQACAHVGERTLVLDCARAHVAATLGLRARFDLMHVLQGDCTLEQARLDAGPDLAVLPAARAAAQARAGSLDLVALLPALAHGPLAADLVLMIVEPASAALLRAAGWRGEVVVPMPLQRTAWSGLLRECAALGDGADIAGFRLLFPAWDEDTAARLFRELARACGDRLATELRFGGAARVARDWPRIARALGDWDLGRLPRPQTVRTF